MLGRGTCLGLLIAAILPTTHLVHADVFHMGSGLTSLETVTVGDPGNASQLSGDCGAQLPRQCGAVNYIYNIGKYEVTAGQYTAFLNAVGGVDTYGLYNLGMASATYGCGIQRSGTGDIFAPYTYTVSPDCANRPVNYVCWGDAVRFANWLHNGQPTGRQNAATTEGGAYSLNGTTSNAGLVAVTRNSQWKWAIASEDEWYKAA